MAIATVQFPPTVAAVSYGRVRLLPDESGALVVPDFVAKTMLALPGVTGPSLPASVASLVAGAAVECETNYIFWAFGEPLPESGRVASAGALLAANGEPAAALL